MKKLTELQLFKPSSLSREMIRLKRRNTQVDRGSNLDSSSHSRNSRQMSNQLINLMRMLRFFRSLA